MVVVMVMVMVVVVVVVRGEWWVLVGARGVILGVWEFVCLVFPYILALINAFTLNDVSRLLAVLGVS